MDNEANSLSSLSVIMAIFPGEPGLDGFIGAYWWHWFRFVVNKGGGGFRGQSGQAIKLFQAPRKISFTFHF